MILSFHPCFEADKNIICAGREPAVDDLAAIKAADAVILPQGCYKSLYEMAHKNCSKLFPDFDARFNYPGKIGQIKLFQEKTVAHPISETYNNIGAFFDYYEGLPEQVSFGFPFVFKFDWGGEGYNVYLIKSILELKDILQKAALFERAGQLGFLIQEYIPSQNKTLRVVVIGQKFISYWRIQKNRECFGSSLAKGATLDFDSDPDLRRKAILSAKDFCKKTKINLAGFDFIFSSEAKIKKPLFLEINYYFGRRGLGGSERFYKMLDAEIKKWINNIGL